MRRWRCPKQVQGGALGFRRVVVQVVACWWRGQRMKRPEVGHRSLPWVTVWGRRKCPAAVYQEGYDGGSAVMQGCSGSV